MSTEFDKNISDWRCNCTDYIIDFENQILALFDGYFWPFNKSHEKIKSIFVISAIIPSIWNVFIKFRWRDEILTRGDREVRGQCWCQSVSWWCFVLFCFYFNAGWFMMPVGWWGWSVDDASQLMKLIISWCWSVDNVSQLIMPVSWWCLSVDDAGWLDMLAGWRWCSVNDADHLMMPVSWWCWLFDDAGQLIMPVSGCFW